jgi:Uncharacterised protein family (UPF0158)
MVDQHSALRVKLSDIIEGLEFQADESFSYLNTATGEVVSVTMEELRAAENDEPLEDFPEWQHDAIRIARDIVATEHYLPLPDRFEINEYRIMERFCLSVDDEVIRDDLCNAIRGRGAFRYFKDRIHAYGIAEEWYRYRDAALREIARAWCEAHGIPYTLKVARKRPSIPCEPHQIWVPRPHVPARACRSSSL